MEGWQRWIIASVLKSGECKSSEGSNPSLSSTYWGFVYRLGRRSLKPQEWGRHPHPPPNKIFSRSDYMSRSRDYTRKTAYKKALRKQRIAREVYSWSNPEWEYYDNLH